MAAMPPGGRRGTRTGCPPGRGSPSGPASRSFREPARSVR
ncbi:hypothetical protein RC1_2009 [Rhodospirillum centenum SW]|uniref:Uncharacterized protein n=1 Tax=Rhodospirillum centenum (strain ATCC 51521 / SW) TaxID=414684 RepID=B6INY2_RHOCS|nr:hypothetical protein RC1_2009 [Rhodospirillum centenum SW]